MEEELIPLKVIQILANKVLPLLEEFFYGESQKIGLVLSEKFLSAETLNPTDLFKSKSARNLLSQLDLDNSEPKPPRALSGPELLAIVNENNALEYLNSILA